MLRRWWGNVVEGEHGGEELPLGGVQPGRREALHVAGQARVQVSGVQGTVNPLKLNIYKTIVRH